MTKSIKRIALATACFLVLSVLSGCAGNPTKTPDTSNESSKMESSVAEENTVLTVMANQTAMKQYVSVCFEEFSKSSGVTVEFSVVPDTQSTVAAQIKLAAGEAPDLISYNMVAGQNDLNVVKNMEILDNEPWVARLINKDILTYNGHIYYADFNLPAPGGLGILYNKTLFEKFKLNVPQKYSEFLAVCEALKSNGITPLFGPFKETWTPQIWNTAGFGSYVATTNPQIWDDINAGKKKFSEVDGFLTILSELDEIYKKGYFQPTALSDGYDLLVTEMASGKYGMTILGDWMISTIETANPEYKMGLFAVPATDNNYVATSQLGTGFYIPKAAKNIKQAKLALDFMSQAAQFELRSTKDGVIQAFPNLVDAKKPELKPYQVEVDNQYYKTGKFCSEMNAFIKVDNTELFKYYQDMLAGGKTPKEVLEAWDKKFAELMKEKGEPGF